MINSRNFCFLLTLAAAGISTRGRSATNTPAPAAPILSAFVLPSNPQQGRDPFYPESTRPYVVSAASTNNIVPVAALIIRGFSGTAENRTVIINNHSFGVGDEGDVLTAAGRVHVRCLAIKANGVVIEANHQLQELDFTTE